jgi:two-component system cell cycle sensor histidine kinase/response regulator CckA
VINTSTIIGLVNNAALLLALGVLYDAVRYRPWGRKPILQQVVTGLILGAIGIAVMLNPWRFAPGVVFDTRSVLLSVAGLFFGALPTLLAIC